MIELNNSLYMSQISGLSGAAGNITSVGNQPELSGDVPSMENLLETYSKISNFFVNYKALLCSDAKNIETAGKAISEREKEIAESIGK